RRDRSGAFFLATRSRPVRRRAVRAHQGTMFRDFSPRGSSMSDDRESGWRGAVQPLYGVIALAAGGQTASATRLRGPFLLPSVFDTMRAIRTGFADGPMLFDLTRTVERTAWAFVIASAIAVPVGIALGAAPSLYRKLEFVIDFFRSTPASAVFPLFLVLFGV